MVLTKAELLLYPKDKRICYGCGRTDSQFGKYKYQQWYLNRGTPFMLCGICNAWIVNKDIQLRSSRKQHKKRITFKGKRISLGEDPRIGVCNYCRAVVPFDATKTHMHHDDGKYDEDDPLRYTIESCISCHGIETWKTGKVASKKILAEQKICVICGSTETFIRTIVHENHRKTTRKADWYHYEEDKVICSWCYWDINNKNRK